MQHTEGADSSHPMRSGHAAEMERSFLFALTCVCCLSRRQNPVVDESCIQLVKESWGQITEGVSKGFVEAKKKDSGADPE